MSDTEQDFLIELQSERSRVCPFKQLLGEMSPDLAAQVKLAMKDKAQYSSMAIVRALERRGFHTHRQRVGDCRSRCDCGEL